MIDLSRSYESHKTRIDPRIAVLQDRPRFSLYDVLNSLLTVTQAGSGTEQCGPGGGSCSQTRSFTYSSLSRLLTATNPESGTFHYQFDNNGNLLTKTDSRNITTSYAYDNLNRLTQKSFSDSTPQRNYYYDDPTVPFSKGRLTKVSIIGYGQSPFSTTQTTAFDELGGILNQTQTTDGQTYNTSYTYNLSGELIEETYPSGRVVKNTLDNNGRLAMVNSRTASGGNWPYARNLLYNSFGAMVSLQLGNGHWESTAYNSRFQLTQIAVGKMSGASDLLKLNYNYGTTQNNGNILSQTITVPDAGQDQGFTAVQTYSYDLVNRIKHADEKPFGWSQSNCDQDAAKCWQQNFVYDRFGNRTFEESTTTTLIKSCGTAPNLTVCSGDRKILNPSISPNTNQIVLDQDGDSVNDYLFDADGNLSRDGLGRSITYDALNKEIEIKNSQNQTIGQYFYDGNNRRVKKISGSESVICVYDAFGKLIAEYSDNLPQDPHVNYLSSDHLGSPRLNTGQSGDIFARHDYFPFGEEISTSNRTNALGYANDNVRQGFTGYEKNDETPDLDFAQARYYSKTLGRFYSVDPSSMSARQLSPQTFNRYVYSLNNPINLIDPSGRLSCPPEYPNCYERDGSYYVKNPDGSEEWVGAHVDTKVECQSIGCKVKHFFGKLFQGSTVQAQEEEPIEPEKTEPLTKQEREELLRSEGFEPREEPVREPMTARQKEDVYRRMFPGTPPNEVPCFKDDPEPSPEMKPPIPWEQLGLPPIPTDPARPPGAGWEWRGAGEPGSPEGAWYKPATDESLHPDLNHPPPILPHWDYKDANGARWRIFLDGRKQPKP